MSTWNSVVFIRSNKSASDINSVAKWEGVESIWSITGDWDWCIKLNQQSSSPEKAEEFVARVRQGQLASETKTQWWKQIAAK